MKIIVCSSTFFKLAVRHLLRNKGYTLINITGLAIGVACGLLILLYIRFELSFDRFHQDSGQIYRVDQTYPGSDNFPLTGMPMAPLLLNDFPEVEQAARLHYRAGLFKTLWRRRGLMPGSRKTTFAFTDPAFFELFDFPLLKGDRDGLLSAPNQLVMTQSMAEKILWG